MPSELKAFGMEPEPSDKMTFPDTFATRYTSWTMHRWVAAQGWTTGWSNDQELVHAYNRKFEAVYAQACKDFDEDPTGFTAKALAEIQELEPGAIDRFLKKQRKQTPKRARGKKGPRHTKPKKR